MKIISHITQHGMALDGTGNQKCNYPCRFLNQWQRFVDIISELLSVPNVMINRLDPPALEIFRSCNNPDHPFPSGQRMQMSGVYCETAAVKRRKLRIVDARKYPQWADSPTAKAGVFAYLGYPILWPDGEMFGTICAAALLAMIVWGVALFFIPKTKQVS